MQVNLSIFELAQKEITMDWNSIYQSRMTTPQEAVRSDQIEQPHLSHR